MPLVAAKVDKAKPRERDYRLADRGGFPLTLAINRATLGTSNFGVLGHAKITRPREKNPILMLRVFIQPYRRMLLCANLCG